MKILVDDAVAAPVRGQIEKLVADSLRDRSDADTLVVSLVKLSPGRGWEVFINDLQDPPLVAEIQSTLKKGGF